MRARRDIGHDGGDNACDSAYRKCRWSCAVLSRLRRRPSASACVKMSTSMKPGMAVDAKGWEASPSSTVFLALSCLVSATRERCGDRVWARSLTGTLVQTAVGVDLVRYMGCAHRPWRVTLASAMSYKSGLGRWARCVVDGTKGPDQPWESP